MFTFLLFIKIKDKFVLSCLKNTPFGLRVTYWACFSFCMFTNDFLCIQSNSHFLQKRETRPVKHWASKVVKNCMLKKTNCTGSI